MPYTEMRSFPWPLTVPPADIQLFTGPALLWGWTIQQPGGNQTSLVTLYDGPTNNGQVVAYVDVPGGTAYPFAIGGTGLRLVSGLTVDIAAAHCQGVIHASLWEPEPGEFDTGLEEQEMTAPPPIRRVGI